MKHIYKGLVVCATLAFGSMSAYAQDELTSEELLADNGDKVHVAFRSTDQKDLLGGVSVIDVEELSKKAYTTYSLDFVENVVGGVNGNIWGNNEYLVVVDGMVRDANNVLPTEIDQITILKGAQAVVLYGPRAAKGVIQITTKRGQEGDLRINLHINSGFHFAKSLPKYMGSAEYMTYYNKALYSDNPNRPVSDYYTEEQIYNHGSGINPYRYPNLDMYSSDYIKKAYNRTEGIAEVTGGNSRVKYYTTFGYYREGNLVKVGKNEDNYISRFFVRGNIDMKLNDILTAQADANVTFYDSYTAKGDWWSNAATLRPHRVAPLIPLEYLDPNAEATLATVYNSNYLIDGKYFFGGTLQDKTNPIADAYAAGDSKFVSRQFQFNTLFNVDLKGLTKGLMFRARYGIDYSTTYNQGYDNQYGIFEPTWTTYNGKEMIGEVDTRETVDSKGVNENISNTTYRYTYNVSAQFDYNRTFGEGHNVFAMVLGNVWQTQRNGEYHRTTNVNLGAQASYNYKQKYYVDFSAAMPYSTKLPSKQRLGFSPTVTLGWRPTAESFFDDTAFDDLMLTASYGIIEQDLDISDYYLWKAVIKRGGWYSWADNEGESATEFERGSNPSMDYIQRKEVNIGLRGSLWNQALTFDFNYFRSEMNGGITQTDALYPIYFIQNNYPTSNIIPYVNYNNDLRQGFDFSVYGKFKLGEVETKLGVSGMYYTTEATQRDEADVSNAYEYKTGRELNGLWGLESLGFFTSEEEIANAPSQTFGEVKPGDLRYKDQNNDGQIDDHDQVFLGRHDTPFRLGINLTLKWKDFTFFAMANGFFGGKGMKNSSYYWLSADSKYSEIARYTWTPETAATAIYPRLTTTDGANNNRNSDFWMYDADRITLGQVQITYDLPEQIFSNSFVKGLSVFAAGYNLLTFAKEREHLEMNVGSAPQTRFFNLGLKATF